MKNLRPIYKKVRVLVLMCVDGSYAAAGAGDKGCDGNDTIMDWLPDMLPEHIDGNDYHKVWITADVPLGPREVDGEPE